MGLTLIIPLRNSTKVPLHTIQSQFLSEMNIKLPLDWDIHICDIVQHEVYQLLVFILPKPFYKGLGFQLFTSFVGR